MGLLFWALDSFFGGSEFYRCFLVWPHSSNPNFRVFAWGCCMFLAGLCFAGFIADHNCCLAPRDSKFMPGGSEKKLTQANQQ
jgi:hypothetical protein